MKHSGRGRPPDHICVLWFSVVFESLIDRFRLLLDWFCLITFDISYIAIVLFWGNIHRVLNPNLLPLLARSSREFMKPMNQRFLCEFVKSRICLNNATTKTKILFWANKLTTLFQIAFSTGRHQKIWVSTAARFRKASSPEQNHPDRAPPTEYGESGRFSGPAKVRG